MKRIIEAIACLSLLFASGAALAASTPEALGAFVKRQMDAWARGFAEAGIVAE